MAIKIHWGANGSYKSSGAVMDDVIPAIKKGRVVITNIRGMSYERCKQTFPDAPDSFDLIYIDMNKSDSIERCRTWFRWAPKGALIIFDETQLIFLKSWKEKDLIHFDHPLGVEGAASENVPASWLDAWTRHRHWNWDIVLTTPNIKYIRDDIRLTSEGAFKHSNYGLLGPVVKKLLGDYKEVFHDAQLNTPPPKSISNNKRIKKEVWGLYDSTATGSVTDTSAGSSLFASTPLLIGLVVSIGAILYSIMSGGYSDLLAKSQTDNSLDLVGNNSASSVVPSGDLSFQQVASSAPVELSPLVSFFRGHKIFISGSYRINAEHVIQLIFMGSSSEPFTVNSTDLEKQGVTFTEIAPCLVLINFESFNKVLGCYKEKQQTAQDKVDTYAGI